MMARVLPFHIVSCAMHIDGEGEFTTAALRKDIDTADAWPGAQRKAIDRAMAPFGLWAVVIYDGQPQTAVMVAEGQSRRIVDAEPRRLAA